MTRMQTPWFVLCLLGAVALILVTVQIWGMAQTREREDPAAQLQRAGSGGPEPSPFPEGVADLSELLEPIRAQYRLPALAAALIEDGKVQALGATGVRRAGGTEPVQWTDRFHLGSDTKAMTATLIASLVTDGTLSWTTTVGEVFGETIPEMDEGWRDVTLEQLLHNRGGAPADLNAGGLWAELWRREGTPRQQRMRLVKGVVTRPPVADPGSKFIYSNAGFALAGAMAEQITDRPWEELMQERIFAPLQITTAGFGAPGTEQQVDQPFGHTSKGKAIPPGPNADNPPAIGPAGTVHMGLSDWTRFILAHLRGDPRNPAHSPEATLLVPEEMYVRMHTPKDNYAMGWLVVDRPWAKGDRPEDVGTALTHAGSNTMWYCVAWLAPERDMAVVVATNQGGTDAEKGTDAAAAALIQYAQRP